MRSRLQNNSLVSVVMLVSLLFIASTAFAQTTSFTYQGRLSDGGTVANGNYDLQFALWTSLTSGAQVGSTQTLNTVAVSNGVFTVSLDFGADAFNGASRFLEISARLSGSSTFTTLSPRQQITSTPYSVRSLRAASADSVAASGIPAGSGNYIQNTSSPQSGNFNITGSATIGQTVSGNVVNAATHFNLGGSRVLSNAGSRNLFAGVGAGQTNTGAQNSFFGFEAGRANTTGNTNSFFGSSAGVFNTSGSRNSFFGADAGLRNTEGETNSFFGANAGISNTSGRDNSFFGADAGNKNTTGSSNTFVGSQTGSSITESSSNTFIGAGAGYHQGGIAIASGNTLLGAGTDFTSGVNNSTAIGAFALVTQSNSLALGSTFTSVGIGTGAPQAQLHVSTFTNTPGGGLGTNGGNILIGDAGCGFGSGGIGFGLSLSGCANYALRGGGDTNTYINRPLGGTIIFREANGSNQVEIRPGGTVGIGVLAGGGGIPLCRNGVAAISACSSSLRYKTAVKPFSGGLQLINRLHPVSFNWKTTQQPDIGLIAEEVAKVEPRLTFKNQNGEIEGVNYSQISAVLINAVKQQQSRIERQEKEIAELKLIVCTAYPRTAICRRKH